MKTRQHKKIKLAYLLTHPIQYQSPLLGRIASEADIDLVVFYQSNCSTSKYYDEGFGCTISWDTPLLENYAYQFLPSVGKNDILGYFKPFNHGLGRRLRDGKFDAIIIHGYNRPYHWLAMLEAKILGIRVFIRDEATLVSKKRGPVKRMLKRLFFGMLGALVEGYLSIGSANAAYYITNGVPQDRIFRMPYAVDNGFFITQAKKAALNQTVFRASLGLAPNRPIVLYASKLQARKGALSLFDAFVQASKSITPPPYLLYVGDGEVKPALLRRIETLDNDAVRFLGFRNQTELPAFYDLCDVFVLVSFSEPWGLVVNEVMNAGKAIIVSDQVGAGTDLVRSGENGYIVPAGDVNALTDCLSTVLSDPSKCKRMGKRSAEIIAHWSFNEDLEGIRLALGLPIAAAEKIHWEKDA